MIAFRAYAKLNLFLRVVGRRDDGYHEIETLFQRVRLSDRVAFERADGEELALECRGPAAALLDASAPENLVSRAHRLLRSEYGERVGGAKVVLEKRIPVGGGLGGGSSDSAAALKGFNRLFRLHLSSDALGAIASRLGADVPFFLGPPCAVGRGVGERLTCVDHAAPFHAVLAFPDQGVSTPAAYAKYDSLGGEATEGDLERLIAALRSRDLAGVLQDLRNDLEPAVFDLHPFLGRLRADLESLARSPVRLTGSGSTLFTLTETSSAARAIARRWERDSNVKTCVTKLQ
ncbi:4-(cytidine 5'-diphospho)-2-C-methyl-D-erythritol kinase [Candidatus Sumerlaeota bacterium]|nr:4-(cytidine 5'-diphospho)-2-C-methyl-D-erythritol kinase [Candidatus Sumerlaeota bacterium]